jgi:hypothetical protein
MTDNDQTSRSSEDADANTVAMTLSMGLLGGVVTGLLLDRIGLGIALGLCTGAVVVGIQLARRPRHDPDS